MSTLYQYNFLTILLFLLFFNIFLFFLLGVRFRQVGAKPISIDVYDNSLGIQDLI